MEPAALFIKNATIVPVVGEKIENGSILVRDGKIQRMDEYIMTPDSGYEVVR